MQNSACEINYFVESRHEHTGKGFARRADFLTTRVFTDRLLERLASQGAAVAIAVHPEEEGVSDLVRTLNEVGIPVDLWLNLPPELGYWQNRGNAGAVRESVERLLDWVARDGLVVRNIGLDIEPPMALVEAACGRRWRALWRSWRALQSVPDGQPLFNATVTLINRRHGVSIYKLPVAADVALLRRSLGLFALPPGFRADPRNQVVAMVYSSQVPLLRRRLVRAFTRPGEIPALGVVSSDDDTPGVILQHAPGGQAGRPRLLGQPDLDHDVAQALALQHQRGEPQKLFVFALNGEGVLDQVDRALDRQTEP